MSFWIPNLRDWVNAGQLKPGMWLQTSAGTHVQVTAIRTWTQREHVYNLTVDSLHTYYVVAGRTPVLAHNANPGGCGSRFAVDSNGVATDLKPLGRGSTGRTTPNGLNEQLAMEQAMSNPTRGQLIPLKGGMNDARWPGSDGWVKMRQNVNGIDIHYVMNTRTGQIDDFKFK